MLSNWFLKVSSIGEFTTFLKASFQWHCEKFSSSVQSESLQEQLVVVGPHLSHMSPWKLLCSHTLNSGAGWQGLLKGSPLFPRLSKPISLSLSSYGSFSVLGSSLWPFCGPPPTYQHMSAWWGPNLKTDMHVWCASSEKKQKNSFFISAGDVIVDAPQHPVAFLCHSSPTLFVHIELDAHWSPKVLFHRLAPWPCRSQTVLHSQVLN